MRARYLIHGKPVCRVRAAGDGQCMCCSARDWPGECVHKAIDGGSLHELQRALCNAVAVRRVKTESNVHVQPRQPMARSKLICFRPEQHNKVAAMATPGGAAEPKWHSRR